LHLETRPRLYPAFQWQLQSASHPWPSKLEQKDIPLFLLPGCFSQPRDISTW
jgi:hypothetical protein